MPESPSVRKAVEGAIDAIRSPYSWCFGAKVKRYNEAAQTVDVQPATRTVLYASGGERVVRWSFEALPVLRDIPLMSLRSTTYAMSVPIYDEQDEDFSRWQQEEWRKSLPDLFWEEEKRRERELREAGAPYVPASPPRTLVREATRVMVLCAQYRSTYRGGHGAASVGPEAPTGTPIEVLMSESRQESRERRQRARGRPFEALIDEGIYPSYVAIPGWYPDTADRYNSFDKEGRRRTFALPNAMHFGDIVRTRVVSISSEAIAMGGEWLVSDPSTGRPVAVSMLTDPVALDALVTDAVREAILHHRHEYKGGTMITSGGIPKTDVEKTGSTMVLADREER